MQTISHISVINLWPSIRAFSEAIGVELEAARKMRQRGRIPPAHWLAVADAAQKANHPEVTMEALGQAARAAKVAAA